MATEAYKGLSIELGAKLSNVISTWEHYYYSKQLKINNKELT